jgi:Skp family chaperone for outer membrane proteins
MRTIAAVAAGLLVGAAGLAGGRVLAALQETKPAATGPCTPVAFVNMNKVFQSYPRAKKLVEELTKENEVLKASLTQREQELRKKAQEVDLKCDPGTDEYETASRDIDIQMAQLKFDGTHGQQRIARKQVQGMAAVYKEVCAEAERVAAAKGFSCVFNMDTDPVMAEEKGQVLGINELKLQMALRTAIWAKPELDITKDVIEAMAK